MSDIPKINNSIANLLQNDGLLKAVQQSAKFNNVNTEFSRIKPIEIPKLRNYTMADYQYEIIRETIVEFEKSLDPDHEIAVKLTSFGQTILLNITDLGYSNPSLIHFYGILDNGTKAELIQHINQINFLLLAVPKAEPEKPARRIGFALEPAEVDNSEPEE